MKNNVTVIVPDKLVVIDGIGYIVECNWPKEIRAIQWHNGSGHIELNDYTNKQIESYEKEVLPYVELWQKLKDVDDKKQEEYIEYYNSTEGKFERLRAKRDEMIAATDFLLLSDYPITDEKKEAVMQYRQALRDLTEQPGAPWDGGEDKTPWPDYPI